MKTLFKPAIKLFNAIKRWRAAYEAYWRSLDPKLYAEMRRIDALVYSISDY